MIGNQLEFSIYKKLKGKDATEKAINLRHYFSENDLYNKATKEKTIYSTTDSYRYSKQGGYILGFKIETVDEQNKIVNIDLNYLTPQNREYVESGLINVIDITYDMIIRSYRVGLKNYIQDDYSIVFKYKESSKILLYNS